MTDDPKLSNHAPVDGEPLPEGDEAPPPGTRTMAIVRWALVALMAVLALGSWAHYAHERGEGKTDERSAALYRCPMHPAVVQDRPGSCSICGMDLVAAATADRSTTVHGARHATPAAATAAGQYWCPMHPEVTSDDPNARCDKCGGMKLVPREEGRAAAPAPVPGVVPLELTAERRQLMGMRTAKAARLRLSAPLRATAFVSADELKVAVVTARASGWIDELKVAQSGQRVRPGEILLTVYSGEVVSAQQAYAQNVQWKKNLASTPNANSPAAQNVDKDSLRRLKLYGMSQVDIDEVARRGEPLAATPIRAPIGGYVARKSVLPGQFVASGTELYQIADLSTVWVVAELTERDLGRVAVGQKARLRVAAYPAADFEGRVDFVYPAVNPETRTIEARMVFGNPDLKLRPGMYGDVTIVATDAEALAVPAEAVVDTGELQYVFVARGEGRFEPRLVKVGARGGDHVEILSGLAAGDEVVTTANFYLDAESRLRAALEGHGAAEATGVTAR